MVKVLKREDMRVGDLGGGNKGMVYCHKETCPNIAVDVLRTKPNIPHVKNHDHYRKESIFYVVEGKVKFTVDGKDYVLTKDDAIVIAPGEKHTMVNVGETDAKFIEFHNHPLWLGEDFIIC